MSPGLLSQNQRMNEYHDNWTEMRLLGKQPSRRSYHSSFIYDKKLYVFGGLDIREGSLNTLYELNLSCLSELQLDESGEGYEEKLISQHKWREVLTTGNDAHKPGNVAYHTSIVHKDNMYLFGGNNTRSQLQMDKGENLNEKICDKMFYLSLKTMSWSLLRTRGDEIYLRDEHTAVFDEEST